MTVKGDLSVIRTPLTDLPEGIVIEGHLFIGGSQITRFPDTMTVKGNIYLGGNQISKWPSKLTLGALSLANVEKEEEEPIELLFCLSEGIRCDYVQDWRKHPTNNDEQAQATVPIWPVTLRALLA